MPHCTMVRWIDSPVDAVFKYMHDLREHLQAAPHINVVDWSLHDKAKPLLVGGTAILRAGRREFVMRISRVIENRLLELEITGMRSVTYERLELEPSMGGTRITHTTETIVVADPTAPKRVPPTQRALNYMLNTIKESIEGAKRSLRNDFILRDDSLRTGPQSSAA
jgi:hypothetical protein